ncbi:hypothetical protein MKJ04_03655 [Pontibacter sp. E15-1]|uniref:hypothetical protein n=1 Tax=Pontibacter sp. E15-1 TaxID=2919918 RepID=UPI001F4F7ABE|nr:hypothetical protein [Pontibacter sp. E15-1]MCJ8163923.1 hypothetical protein [Pontibacter sp. E15-1]
MMQLTWLLAIPMLALLLWLAWRRPNRQRLAARLLASGVAVASLVLLVFPPATKQAISPGTAILLTEGYNPDTLRQLLGQAQAKPEVYSYRTSADKATPLESLYLLRKKQPGLVRVHLLGYGVRGAELQALHGLQVKAHLAAEAEGMAAVHWPESVTLGEAVEVSGRYKVAGKNGARLYLQAAGQAQDSAVATADTTTRFGLRYTPKQTGQFIYTILRKSGGTTDTLGQVPVQVKPVKALGVLLLASSPLFEFRFLKNHLAAQQHGVALRTAVSKGIYQQEWLNMPRTSLDRLTPKLLQQFDVVLTEPQALQLLSATERATLQRAVTEEGLGVLTISNAPATQRSTAFFTSFQMERRSRQDARSTRASWADNAPASVTAAPYSLVRTTAVTGLVAGQPGQLLAAAKRAGWGKVALSLVPQTFPWQLEGQQAVYASYWASLLSGVARQEVQDRFWQLSDPQVPQPNQPLTLTFTDYTTPYPALPAATVMRLADSSTVDLPLAQNPVQPAQFSGTFRPHRSGWHRAQAPDTAPYFFFVQDTSDWVFADLQARRQETQAFLAQQQASPTADGAIAYTQKPLPLLWFFLLFVLSSGFLWLEEKF